MISDFSVDSPKVTPIELQRNVTPADRRLYTSQVYADRICAYLQPNPKSDRILPE